MRHPEGQNLLPKLLSGNHWHLVVMLLGLRNDKTSFVDSFFKALG
jgi:hypothetical protein